MGTFDGDILAEIAACAEGIKDRVARAEKAIVGRDAILTSGGRKMNGRRGKIDGVTADDREGLLFLLMIYKNGTTEFLNAGSESRCYRPIEDMKLCRD